MISKKKQLSKQNKTLAGYEGSLSIRLLPLIFTALLTGCSGSQHGDLEGYIADVKSRQKSRIPELPQIKTYAPFSYSAFDVRDPFVPLLDEEAFLNEPKKDNGLRPKTDRKAEPLESFPLDTLEFVGNIEKRGTRWGLVSAPDKSIYKVQVGNYIGKNFGEIIKITDTKILLREIISDGSDGWLDREASLALSE